MPLNKYLNSFIFYFFIVSLLSACFDGRPSTDSNQQNPTPQPGPTSGGGSGSGSGSGSGTTTSNVFSFGASSYNVVEGNTVTITINRSVSSGTASIVYGTHSMTAVHPTDYTGYNSRVLSFAPGEASKTVTVQTVDDTVVENQELFQLVLSTPSTGYTLAASAVDINVIDNDSTSTTPPPPPGNTPPTISGQPATSIAVNSAYNFTPVASDADGDTLSFSISNKPSWLMFDPATGSLTGTPASTDTGVTNNIQISVFDGTDTTPLPSFNLTVFTNVSPSQVTVSLNWNAGSSGGSAVSGYYVHYGTKSGSLSQSIDVGNVTNVQLSGDQFGFTQPGIYYFQVTAYDAGLIQSLPTAEIPVNIQP